AIEIERACPPATTSECGDWLESIAPDVLRSRAALVAEIESSASISVEGLESHVKSLLHPKSTLEPQPLQAPAPQATVPQGLPSTGSFRLPYAPYLEGPPVTQPSSISVSAGSIPARANNEGGSQRAVAFALIGLALGASAFASALVYRYVKQPPPVT